MEAMPTVSSSVEKLPQIPHISLTQRHQTIRHPEKCSKPENDSLCRLVRWKLEESLWPVRPDAVLFWSFASSAKEFLFPQWKGGFQEQVDSCDLLLQLLRCQLQVSTSASLSLV